MTDPNPIDNTTDDYSRFEARLVAHDQDATRVVIADLGDTTARQLVTELIDNGVVLASGCSSTSQMGPPLTRALSLLSSIKAGRLLAMPTRW